MLIPAKSALVDQVYPLILDPTNPIDKEKIKGLIDDPQITVVDQIDNQAVDLVKAAEPGTNFTQEQLTEKLDEFFGTTNREDYGNWVYYPWKYSIVHLLPEEEFVKVRTLRNNYKITPQEQAELAQKKVGIVGLSVGQSIALVMALERSCGELRLADFDTLELSNLNRLRAGVTSLGTEKVVIAAREISELDPYLKLTLYREGITKESIDDFFEKGGMLDLIVDECDSLDIKVLLREKARSKKVSLMMETSDRGMLDIERYDIEPNRPLFHGYLGEVNVQSLSNLTNKQKVPMVLKITGEDTLSTRMKASLLEVTQSITSWPQLASAVFLGGASVGHVARKFLLGESVQSGRYYVDLDELVPVPKATRNSDSSNQPVTRDWSAVQLPESSLESPYKLDKIELEQLIRLANLAPSGGNCQPWKWIMDQKGVLHLFEDKVLSHSLLDYKSSGSLLAFGAALETIRLAGADMGLELEIDFKITEFDQDYIAQVRFLSKSSQSLKVPFASLTEAIPLRCTNRKNGPKVALKQEDLELLTSIGASESGIELELISSDTELKLLAKVIGGMDRYRLLHEQGYSDFMNEIRWSDEEAKSTGDGIDIATLEMDPSARAAMGLVRDPGTVEFFRKQDLGFGLSKISDDTVLTSSAVLMIQSEQYDPVSILKAGMTLQRIWLQANLLGISVQPISASLFIFHRVENEEESGFTKEEKAGILELKKDLNQIFNKDNQRNEIFMIRLNKADEPSMRSYRRDVWESLIVL
ncbi:Rv1355c family protein [Algoriphagus vanfongensis]|uniref:Rv1355c family protein n=1 Tax=Algoriphagus vanfongensis TaxID=426371 RepID=UPI00041F3F18|nr:Rv1355c family protein [Algoriphagus vanfongensis]